VGTFLVFGASPSFFGRDKFSPTWHAYARRPRILESRWTDSLNLVQQCRFPEDVKAIGAMLIAHARRCSSCFGASRATLIQLGFDEPALDAMCANPDALPLDRRSLMNDDGEMTAELLAKKLHGNHAQPPRVECPTHGIRQVRLPWAEARARFTSLFERLAIGPRAPSTPKSAERPPPRKDA
jgi:hypothetical protein